MFLSILYMQKIVNHLTIKKKLLYNLQKELSYYSGGAVTHSSAYNYRANRLAARIARIIGEDGKSYQKEADAILEAMNDRLWLEGAGHWAEYQDLMGLKRVHESAAVWSIYTPIDCGACTPEQAYQATKYIDREIPHIPVGNGQQLAANSQQLYTISTSNWQPYSWSINNVAAAEVMHTALAYFEAGRSEEGYQLMMANVMDQMYDGQSPANFDRSASMMLPVVSAIATLATASVSRHARLFRGFSAFCLTLSRGVVSSVPASLRRGIRHPSAHLIYIISTSVRATRRFTR